MKKITTIFLFFLLSFSLVFAAGQQDVNDTDKGMQEAEPTSISAEPTQVRDGYDEGQGETVREQEEPVLIQERKQLRVHNATELGDMIQERKRLMDQDVQKLGKDEQKVYQNQNKVRLAVHALLAMEDLDSGIGKQVSAIARECNNSVQATINAEERIQKRGGFKRLLAGGDNEAADELEQEVNQTRQRIKEMKQLIDGCSECDEQTRALMQEQLQNMDQEQTRLEGLAKQEKSKKGMFGWLWK